MQIDNKVFDLNVTVKKQNRHDGGYTYTLFLTDNKKIEASPAQGAINPLTSQAKPLSNSSISQSDNFDNNNYIQNSENYSVENDEKLKYSVKDPNSSEQNKQKMYETKAREISDALLRGENPELVTEGYENFDVDDWLKIRDLMNKYYNEANKQASAAQQAEFKQKVSKLFENSLHKDHWNDDMKAEADKRSGEFEYETITNKSTYEKAEKKVNKMGLDKSYLDIMERANSDAEFTADDTAQVLCTMSLLQNEGRYEEAVNVAAAFRNKVTSAAQLLQAMNIINKLSPEGCFILLTRDAKTINEKSRDSIMVYPPYCFYIRKQVLIYLYGNCHFIFYRRTESF